MRFKKPLAIAAIFASSLFGLVVTAGAVSAETPAPTVKIVAGTGMAGGTGDGGQANAAQISDLAGLAVDASGRIDLYDRGERQIRQVDNTTGLITSVVGNGSWCDDQSSPPAGPITGICPGSGLAVASNGVIYYGDNYGISQSVDGVSTHFAGATLPNQSMADGPNSTVNIYPSVIRVNPANGLAYYLDSQGHGIREIDVSGNVSTPIGTADGPTGCSPITPLSGISAYGACFWPQSFDFFGDDIYFTDVDSNGVYYLLLDHNGLITVLAGGGTTPYNALPALATTVQLPVVSALTVTPDGSVFLAANQSGQIFKLSADGSLSLTYEFSGRVPYLASDSQGNVFANVHDAYQVVELVGVGALPPVVVPPTPVCPSVYVLGVRGSGQKSTDNNGFGSTVAAVIDAMRPKIPNMEADAIDYPAIAVGYGGIDYGSDYVLSETAGVNNLDAIFNARLTACPHTYMVFVGYSQGAQVVGDEYLNLPAAQRKHVAAVTMIGDPKFNPAQSLVDVGSYSDKLSGIYQFISPAMRVIPKGNQDDVRSYCIKGDPICNFSKSNAAKCTPPLGCIHTTYPSTKYPSDAASFTARRVISKKQL